MYLSSKKHILSQALINATVIQIMAVVAQFVIRICMHGKSKKPDILNIRIWTAEYIVTCLSIALTLLVFVLAIKKVKKYIDVIDEEDRKMMGRLQEDKLGESLSALSADVMLKLLKVWAVILVGLELIHAVVSVMYRRFIVDLYALNTPKGTLKRADLINIYNHTHGFKYLTMAGALVIGVIITAVILENRMLEILSVAAALLFLTAFCAVDSSKISVFGMNLRIVWTSVIFHIIQTVGMVSFAIYLRVKYKGV